MGSAEQDIIIVGAGLAGMVAAQEAVLRGRRVLLIDPNGELKAVFGAPHVPDNFVHDLPLITGGR